MKATPYDVITDRILEHLERGVVPWRKPWKGGQGGIPRNLLSDKPYRGINVFLLAMAGFGSPHFVTFRQARKLGGSVRRGEKGLPVFFWKWYERDKGGRVERIPCARYYTVFNAADQCEGLDVPDAGDELAPFEPLDACEAIASGMPAAPRIVEGGTRACYRPSTDTVMVPDRGRFEPAAEYYSTLFHELVHATGHESRLARDGIVDDVMFGSHVYSNEELVAEIGAAYLCGHTGIDNTTLDNSAAYIAHWLERLRDDKRLIIQAAARAQKAVDLILDQAYDPAAAGASIRQICGTNPSHGDAP